MSTWRPPLWYERLAGMAWRAVIIVAAFALFVMGVVALNSVILPIVLGLLFSCGLRPLADRLRRLGLRRSLTAGSAILVLLAAIGAVAWLTVNSVVDQWDEIVALIGNGRSTLVDAATDQGVDPSTAASVDESIADFVGSAAATLVGGLVHFVPTLAGIVTNLLLSFLVAFFFLKDGPIMWQWIVAHMGATEALVDRIGGRVWQTLSAFIGGQTVIAAVDATLIALGAIVLGVPHAGAIFMLTLFGAYVPYIGAFLSGLLAVLLRSGSPAWTVESPCSSWSSWCRSSRATCCNRGSRAVPCACIRSSSRCLWSLVECSGDSSACSSPSRSPPPPSSPWQSCAGPESSVQPPRPHRCDERRGGEHPPVDLTYLTNVLTRQRPDCRLT